MFWPGADPDGDDLFQKKKINLESVLYSLFVWYVEKYRMSASCNRDGKINNHKNVMKVQLLRHMRKSAHP